MDTCLLADQPAAVEAVGRWWFDEWGRAVQGNRVENAVTEARGCMNRNRAPLAIVAIEAGEPLGVAVWKPHEMIDRYPDWEHWLGGVYVAHHARGRGVATRLCQAVIDAARAHGAPRLYLQTEAFDGGLYARLGWQPIEQVRHKGRDVLVMVRSL